MAMSDDFHMYFNGTYVGLNREGYIVPFYIEMIQNDSAIFDYDDHPESEWFGDLALSAITFRGVVNNPDGSTSQVSINHDDPDLVLEMPDSKYITYRGRYYWVSWKANKSTKKGLCSRRLSGMPTFNNETVAAMFSIESVPNVYADCLLITGNELHYKGVVVGSFNDNNIVLVPEAAHLLRLVSREIPQCQTTVAAE